MMEHVVHTFSPIYDSTSQVLILGSVPSVKSRENGFYYGHPQNRFWKLLTMLKEDSFPVSIDDKIKFLLKHHIALWDVVYSCDIIGSSDTSIRNVVPNDISLLLRNTTISRIYTNGAAAGKLYQKHIYPQTHVEAVTLPSTSPANAAFSLEKLMLIWKQIL